MSLDLEARLRVFLASAPSAVRRIPTLEITHSAMSKTYYLWHEPYAGEITTEDGVRAVEPVHFEIALAGSEAHLDQSFEIRLSTVDIEDEFREQMDLVPLDTQERIRCVYREYLSDDLTDVLARAVLQVETVSFQIGAATISAVSPRLNSTRTGESYNPRDIPMLRGFI
jgi:hypothetical protein